MYFIIAIPWSDITLFPSRCLQLKFWLERALPGKTCILINFCPFTLRACVCNHFHYIYFGRICTPTVLCMATLICQCRMNSSKKLCVYRASGQTSTCTQTCKHDITTSCTSWQDCNQSSNHSHPSTKCTYTWDSLSDEHHLKMVHEIWSNGTRCSDVTFACLSAGQIFLKLSACV